MGEATVACLKMLRLLLMAPDNSLSSRVWPPQAAGFPRKNAPAAGELYYETNEMKTAECRTNDMEYAVFHHDGIVEKRVH